MPRLTSFLAVPLILGFSGGALAASNEVPITIGGPARQANLAFVEVTLCEPGSARCQTIPDIQLDSGSTGLRLFRSKLALDPQPQKSASGAALGECKIFGGGESFWGLVAKMDVVLGGEKAPGVSVQVVDPGFARLPSDCRDAVTQLDQSSHGNGILGIGPALSDCGGSACDPGHYLGARYYACSDGASCAELALPLAMQVQNPVALMPIDDNGVLIRFPAVPSNANDEAAYRGALILGVGTADNNRPGRETQAFRSDSMGWVPVALSGSRYWSKIDTGADQWNFPSGKSGLPHCAGSQDIEPYLCPASPAKITATIHSVGRRTERDIRFEVRNAREALASDGNRLLQTGIAYEYGGLTSDIMILGLPFFFGREVWIGIDGKKSPLDAGPFYAF